LNRGILHPEKNEGDEGHASNAVGFEAVRGGTNGIASIVAGAIGDDAGIARVIFFNLEDDLHQVGADIGDLGEDTASNTESGRTEGFADGKSDEAWAGVIARNEQENDKHDEELDADQHHADTHAGFERNLVNREGLAGK
jgi:uncharacterized membrane protein YtjA (UPF0391 family)